LTASDYTFGIFRLLVIVLSVLHGLTASDYTFGIFRLLVTVLSVLHGLTASDYTFGIFRLFYELSIDKISKVSEP
jgi:hypothetical protein